MLDFLTRLCGYRAVGDREDAMLRQFRIANGVRGFG